MSLSPTFGITGSLQAPSVAGKKHGCLLPGPLEWLSYRAIVIVDKSKDFGPQVDIGSYENDRPFKVVPMEKKLQTDIVHHLS